QTIAPAPIPPSFPTRRSSDLGFVAELTLLNPTDTNGKVQLRFALGTKTPGSADGQGVAMESATIVATPPNQLTFFDKKLPDGAKDRKSTRLNSSHGSISYAVF